MQTVKEESEYGASCARANLNLAGGASVHLENMAIASETDEEIKLELRRAQYFREHPDHKGPFPGDLAGPISVTFKKPW